MKENISPSAEVLHAFQVQGTPQRLPGGEGTSFVVNDVVFKPVANEAESIWRAEVLSTIHMNGFIVTTPLKTRTGLWTHQGWEASLFLQGKEVKGRWSEKIAVCRKFHQALQIFPKPDFLAAANHPWAVADRMIWGEQPLEYGEPLKKIMARLEKMLRPIDAECQLIHGDMSGNILFNESLPPAVIDVSPYWRPAEYAVAIIIVDSVVWEGAGDDILDEMPNTFLANQLLIRAAMWRIKTTEEYIRQFGRGNIEDVNAYEHLVELIEARVVKV
jgi:uncharacterized protein (TIGR02569 family)